MPTLDDAVRVLQSGDYKEGEHILKHLLRRNRNNPDILYNLGMAYSEQGKLEESIETLEKCIALDPSRSHAYTALGFSYARTGKYREAAQKTRQALELDPDNFYAWKNLGGVYAKQREMEKALEAFEQANTLQKEVPDVLYGMALVYEELGNTTEADRLYKWIIQQNRSPHFAELAERARTQIAMATMVSALRQVARRATGRSRTTSSVPATSGEPGNGLP